MDSKTPEYKSQYLLPLSFSTYTTISRSHTGQLPSEELLNSNSLSHRKKNHILEQEPIPEPLFNFMIRVKSRLRGILVWRSVLKHVKENGTSSRLINMNNRYRRSLPRVISKLSIDLSSQEEEDPKLGCLFSPKSRFKELWNLLMLILLLYVFLATPWILAFEDVEFWSFLFYIELSVDFLFLIDIFVTLNSAYTKNNVLVVSRYKIFINYLTGLLLVDIIAVFPFFLFEDNSGNSNSLVRIIRITKVTRVFRASKMLKVIQFLANIEWMQQCIKFMKNYEGLTRLFVASLLVLIMGHFVACMWYFTAKLDGLAPETWPIRYGFADASKSELYLASLYWTYATLTTVGFGDIAAFTVGEMLLSLAWMLFGIAFYSFLVGTLTSVLSSIDSQNGEIKSYFDRFASTCGVSDGVIRQLKLEAIGNQDLNMMKETRRMHILSMLSEDTRRNVCLSMYGGAVCRIPILCQQDSVFITNIVPRLEPELFLQNAPIYNRGDHPESIFFITVGKVGYVVKYGSEEFVFKSMISGSYFGEIEHFEKTPRLFSVIAEEDCELLVMNQMLFWELCSEYIKVAVELQRNMQERKLRDFQALQETIELLEAEFAFKHKPRTLAGQKRIISRDDGNAPRQQSDLFMKEFEKTRMHLMEIDESVNSLLDTDVSRKSAIQAFKGIRDELLK